MYGVTMVRAIGSVNDKNCDVAENVSAPFEKCVLRNNKTEEERLISNLVAIITVGHLAQFNRLHLNHKHN